MIALEVGGGFGAKLNIYREEILVPYLAMKLGKPIKWTQTRREDFAATIHGRGQVQYIEAAAKKDGTVTAIKANSFPSRCVSPILHSDDSRLHRLVDERGV